MEKALSKAAVYGFLIGMGLMILFTPYETVEYISVGATITTEISTKKYVITLLQNVTLFTFSVLLATFIWYKWKKSWVVHIGIFLVTFFLALLLISFMRT